MSRASHHTLGWSLTRPCLFHPGELDYIENPVDMICCQCGALEDENPENTECEYDVEIRVIAYPGAPARTPPGEYAPIDPPEPPSIEICEVWFAGTRVAFPWPLTADEEAAIGEEAYELAQDWVDE